MSAITETTTAGEQSFTGLDTGRLRQYLGGRRGLVVLATVVLAAGAFFNWGWLVAAGIAPLLLGFAPCAAMCALGLCMNKMGGKSCSAASNSNDQSTKGKKSVPIQPR